MNYRAARVASCIIRVTATKLLATGSLFEPHMPLMAASGALLYSSKVAWEGRRLKAWSLCLTSVTRDAHQPVLDLPRQAMDERCTGLSTPSSRKAAMDGCKRLDHTEQERPPLQQRGWCMMRRRHSTRWPHRAGLTATCYGATCVDHGAVKAASGVSSDVHDMDGGKDSGQPCWDKTAVRQPGSGGHILGNVLVWSAGCDRCHMNKARTGDLEHSSRVT